MKNQTPFYQFLLGKALYYFLIKGMLWTGVYLGVHSVGRTQVNFYNFLKKGVVGLLLMDPRERTKVKFIYFFNSMPFQLFCIPIYILCIFVRSIMLANLMIFLILMTL